MRPRVLFICGSLNQTTMMHRIAQELRGVDPWFTPYYCDGFLDWLNRRGMLDFTVAGKRGPLRSLTEEFLRSHRCQLDLRGGLHTYDLILTCSDLVVQRNVRGRPMVLVQEGMTDPEDWMYHVVRTLRLPRWLASTSMTGLSLAYQRFCVASEGYRDHFVSKGVPKDRIVVTGIPNYDHCSSYLVNDFPHRGYVLVATSDTRETFKWDLRRRFFAHVEGIAAGRPLLFKLHPNENAARATAEIESRFPGAPVFSSGNVDHMIANCSALVTQYSTVVYTGLALGKECHSYFDLAELRRLMPWQNGGRSARHIAKVCQRVLTSNARRRTHEERPCVVASSR